MKTSVIKHDVYYIRKVYQKTNIILFRKRKGSKGDLINVVF